MLKSMAVLVALMGAFYLSISYRFGDPGWQLEYRAPEAAAQVENKTASNYDLRELNILSRAVIHIKENYVDPDRVDTRKMLGAAMEEVQRSVAELLVDVKRDAEDVPHQVTVKVGDKSQSFDLQDVGNLWQMSFKFKDILSFVEGNLEHHDQLQEIEYAAINGMLSTLDPHSVLLRPKDYREMKLSTRGKFGGLGIVINIREGHLTVVNPIEDTPASRAGLQADDRIVQIDQDSTVNMSLDDAVNMLRGAPNTTVDVWILREGWKKPRKYTLTRANIKVKSVLAKRLRGNVGLVRLRNFQNTTFDELKQAMADMGRKGRLRGLVLDLRGNPGGLLDQAIKIADLFVESGPLVTTVGYGDKMHEPKMATRSGTERMPVAVLIDESSASASEIVAGALKNHKRAVIIGQRTFGKGSVQVIYDNKDDSALKLTIAQYLTPGDLSIQSVGIAPDIETRPVRITEEVTDMFRSETFRKGEADLPSHLEHESSRLAKAIKPLRTVKYLVDEELLKEIRENPNKIIPDFEIELARAMVSASRSGHRDGMLDESQKVVDERAAGQEERIREALEARGVSWVVAEKGGTPKAEIRVKSDHADHRVKAGEKLTLTVTVTNIGDGPFSRLRAITESDNEVFAGYEFLFGTFGPGESKTWTLPIEVPMDALSRADDMSLVFNADPGHAVPDKVSFRASVDQLPRPHFALNYRIDDTKGNGDGLLQAGEDAELVVTVENVGRGAAAKVIGVLKTHVDDAERGVFIKRGRVESEGLAAGAQRSLRFAFSTKATLVGPINLPVAVHVLDSELREATMTRVPLKIAAAEQTVKPANVRLLPRMGDSVALRGLPNEDAQWVAQAERYAVADAQVGKWYRVPYEGNFVWVLSNEVTAVPTDGSQMKAQPAGFVGPAQVQLEPPVMTTQADSVQVKGSVRLGDHQLEHVLVYVNNKKVFFRAGAGATGKALAFDTDVPLEPGVNKITVVARQSDEATDRRTAIVRREPVHAAANQK